MDPIAITDDDINKSIRSLALNSELDNAGQAIYQGLRRLYDATQDIDNESNKINSDTFYSLYQTSIGFERLIKIVHRLAETSGRMSRFGGKHDIAGLHQAVVEAKLLLSSTKEEEGLLKLLTDFMNTSTRYYNLDRKKSNTLSPKDLLLAYNLNATNKPERIWRTSANLIKKYYEIIRELSHELNIFTYEIRYDSDAGKIFNGARIYDSIFDIFEHEDRAFNEYVISLISLHKKRDDLSNFGKHLLGIDNVSNYLYTEHNFLDVVKSLRQGIMPVSIIDTVDETYSEVDVKKAKDRRDTLEVFNSQPAEGLLRDDYYDTEESF